MSASELRADFRNMFLQNSKAGTFKHVFCSVESQLRGETCLLHKGEASCCDPCNSMVLDLMVSGSPCDPFSTQSGKRFAADAVTSHKLFSVTMQTIVSMYAEKQPRIGLFKGFLMPFDSTAATTPFDRPA